MTTVLRLRVAEKSVYTIRVCDDCPFHCDPDPRPCFCRLDRDAHVGGPLPDNCPLPRLHIEVVERSAEDER